MLRRRRPIFGLTLIGTALVRTPPLYTGLRAWKGFKGVSLRQRLLLSQLCYMCVLKLYGSTKVVHRAMYMCVRVYYCVYRISVCACICMRARV